MYLCIGCIYTCLSPSATIEATVREMMIGLHGGSSYSYFAALIRDACESTMLEVEQRVLSGLSIWLAHFP